MDIVEEELQARLIAARFFGWDFCGIACVFAERSSAGRCVRKCVRVCMCAVGGRLSVKRRAAV